MFSISHFTLKHFQKGRELGILEPMCEILKIAYLRNYNANSNQIMHCDKDHQVRFVGGTN